MQTNDWITLGTVLVLLACLATMVAKRRREERYYREGDLIQWRASRQFHQRTRLRRVK